MFNHHCFQKASEAEYRLSKKEDRSMSFIYGLRKGEWHHVLCICHLWCREFRKCVMSFKIESNEENEKKLSGVQKLCLCHSKCH